MEWLVNGQLYTIEVVYRTCLWMVYETIGKCGGRGISIEENRYLLEEWKIDSMIINNEAFLSIASNDRLVRLGRQEGK